MKRWKRVEPLESTGFAVIKGVDNYKKWRVCENRKLQVSYLNNSKGAKFEKDWYFSDYELWGNEGQFDYPIDTGSRQWRYAFTDSSSTDRGFSVSVSFQGW